MGEIPKFDWLGKRLHTIVVLKPPNPVTNPRVTHPTREKSAKTGQSDTSYLVLQCSFSAVGLTFGCDVRRFQY